MNCWENTPMSLLSTHSASSGLAIERLNGAVLSRFFSYSVLSELSKFGYSNIAGRISHQNNLFDKFPPGTTVAEFYNDLFNWLLRSYRHEYIYKNAIAEKVLLGKHNLKTAFMVTEFPVGSCKADVAIFNGTSHVYEIKSEMDNFDRLDRQISAYKNLFEYITVITSEKLYKTVESRVDESIGIMVLANDGYRFKKSPSREPKSNLSNMKIDTIFNSLRKNEYLEILQREFNLSLTTVPNTQVYDLAKQHFGRLDLEIAHDEMVKAIKRRSESKRVSEFIEEIPKSLIAAFLSLKLSKAHNSSFIKALKSDITVAFKI